MAAAELLAVRALILKYEEVPISKLKAEVGKLAEFQIGELSGIEARRLAQKARSKGVRVGLEDSSYTSYLPVNEKGCAVLIEDNN
jgi:hypothetical protein